jgi:outer membrane usher protein
LLQLLLGQRLSKGLLPLCWAWFACTLANGSTITESTLDVRLRQSEALPAQVNRDTVVSVTINGFEVLPSLAVVEVPGLGFALTKVEYDSLGLNSAKPWMAVRGDEDYVVLSRIPGLGIDYNPRRLTLALNAPVDLLSKTAVRIYTESGVQVRSPSVGAYLNYDIHAQSRGKDQTGTATLETVAFSAAGSLVSLHQFAARSDTLAGSLPQHLRLGTYYQWDRPDQLQRLRLGDSVSSSGSWGRSVSYGGLKFGTDFSLNPQLVTLPMMAATGSAAVPSVVDLFVNGALQRRFEVPAGTFTIDQIPAVSGNGNARIVVRDPQGREQVIEQPFYRTPQQLRPGLWSYAADMGRLRQQLGYASNDYGDSFAAVSVRGGLTDWLTTETRIEWSQDKTKNIGLGAALAFGQGHALAPSIQVSDSPAGRGLGYQLGYSYTGTSLRLAARLEQYDAHYRQLGFGPTEQASAHRALLSAGYRIGPRTDLGLLLTDHQPRGADRVRIMTLSATHRLDREWYLIGNISQTQSWVGHSSISGSKNLSSSLTLSWTPDYLSNLSLSVQHPKDSSDRDALYSARYSKRAPLEGGIGTDIEGHSNQAARARLEYQGQSGAVYAEAVRFPSDSTVAARLGAQGAVSLLAGSVNTSRKIDDSFVLVRAPEAAGESVSRGGRVYRLNQRGEAVIERVQPYQNTRIAIAAANMPLEMEIGRAEEKVAVPSRSGILVDMPLRRRLPASFNLLVAGKHPEPGTQVKIGERMFQLGLDGLVYLPDILELGARSKGLEGLFIGFPATSVGAKPITGAGCQFQLPIPEGQNLLDFGNIECR